MSQVKPLIRATIAIAMAMLLSGCIIEPAWGPYYHHRYYHHWDD
ncbi:MAG TPA: hypothetical protein PLD10_11670 [Rhodopila sp.]|nr:hypothetical protein [Rhodopila sp.]